jgi:CRP-like cAMP-binding protein
VQNSELINRNNSLLRELGSIDIFKNCKETFLGRLADTSLRSEHAKGKVLFLQGDEASRFYFVHSGWVKLYRETPEGTQAVLDIISHGHIFGETAIFEEGHYPFYAEVVEKAAISSFDLKVLENEIKNNQSLAYDMLNAMARHRRHQDFEIEHRSIQNASQRIGCFLLRLSLESNNTHKVKLPYDKTLVASKLGMQPETFSRALSKLKKNTNIEVQGSLITIPDYEKLTEYCCSVCSSEYPCKDISTKD